MAATFHTQPYSETKQAIVLLQILWVLVAYLHPRPFKPGRLPPTCLPAYLVIHTDVVVNFPPCFPWVAFTGSGSTRLAGAAGGGGKQSSIRGQ